MDAVVTFGSGGITALRPPGRGGAGGCIGVTKSMLW